MVSSYRQGEMKNGEHQYGTVEKSLVMCIENPKKNSDADRHLASTGDYVVVWISSTWNWPWWSIAMISSSWIQDAVPSILDKNFSLKINPPFCVSFFSRQSFLENLNSKTLKRSLSHSLTEFHFLKNLYPPKSVIVIYISLLESSRGLHFHPNCIWWSYCPHTPMTVMWRSTSPSKSVIAPQKGQCPCSCDNEHCIVCSFSLEECSWT